MSWQATNWAMREASTHGDARAKLVLMCLADYARPDGTGAYPKIATISAVTEIPERTVIRKLALLKELGLIRLGDQRLVAGYARDRRPVVYDLAMGVDRESGMDETTEAARHAEANETGCQNDTPHVYKERRGDRMTPRMDGTGCQDDTSRGDKTTSHIRNNKEIKTNTPIAPKGARRHEIPDDWTPDGETMALASSLGLDVDAELERFRLHAQANRRRLADWDKGFQLWLRTSAAKPIPTTGMTPGKPHTHSWACEHTRGILERFDIEPSTNLELASMVANRLKSGETPETIADMLAAEREREWMEVA